MIANIGNAQSVYGPLPQAIQNFSQVMEKQVFHAYNEQKMSFFSSEDIDEMLCDEMTAIKNGQSVKEVFHNSIWREYISNLRQLQKPCTNGNAHNTDSVILTEDVLVGYFEKEVLHFILLWVDDTHGNRGWVLPGKRDRGYALELLDIDISVRDAMFSLVEKEIGVGRDQICFHTLLGYFDDRKREQRMRSNGLISFVLLDKKPNLEFRQKIGVPCNAFLKLVQREIRIPPFPACNESFGMARNHDSMLLAVIQTAKFYNTMEKVRIMEARFRNLLRNNRHAARPPMPTIEPSEECHICFNLLVGAKVICSNGHTICGICLPKIQELNNGCDVCRQPLLNPPINNLMVDDMMKSAHPEQYRLRYQQLHGGKAPPSWHDYSAFKGKRIDYGVE